MMNEISKAWSVSYGQWVVRNRWLVLTVSLLIAAVTGFGVSKLGFSNNYRVFFGEDNPQLLAFEALENVYNKQDNILFVLAPADGQIFTQPTVAAISWLTTESWQLPFARRVDSTTNFQNTEAYGDDLVVQDLVQDPENTSPEELAAALKVAMAEPRLKNLLVSSQAHVTGVNVTLELPGETPFEVLEIAAAARELAAEFEAKYPDIKVYLTGIAMLNNAFAENSQRDMKTLVPIMFAAMVLVVVLTLRSIAGAGATLVLILLSTAAGMGIAGWLGIKISPASSVAPTMIMTLAVADSIHILVTLLAAMRRGMSKWDAIVESLRINVQPVFITSLTTAIGFLSLNLSDAPPFRDLGNISAMGVTAALFFSLGFLPALMAILPVRQPRKAKNGGWGMSRIASLVTTRSRPLLWGSVGVILLIAVFIPRNKLDDQFVEYFDESIAFRVDTDFTSENLTGIYQAHFDLGSGSSGGISEPAYLAKLDEFEAWFREQEGVMQVLSLSHTLKRLNKNMHGDDPTYFRTPETRELAAQYLLLFEMSLPYGLDLNNQINVDKSASRFAVNLTNMSSNEMRTLVESAEDWLRQNAPEHMFSHGIGPIIMFTYISERNARSMLFGTVIALILISACLIFALRSLRYGLLSLVPNLIPAILTFGIWGILVSEINLGLANVLAMSLGIVADDTIHFLTKYLRARREEGLPASEAIHYAFDTVGKALVITSLILVTGFFVMTRSAFALNSNMGWFTIITITVALIADFILLPSLLMHIDRGKKQEQPESEASVALAANPG